MKSLKYYFTLTCSVLFMLSLSLQAQAKANLVGWWTFEPGKELKDLTGNFGDLILNGAKVEKGQLDVDAGKWAVTGGGGYKGPKIAEKTMVSWASLDSLDVTAGSVLTIDRITVDEFDAIVYAERQPRRWMAGSSFFRRTTDPNPGFEEKEKGKLIQMAISYADSKGNAAIKIYRNGEVIGDYTQGPLANWDKNDAEVFFGLRHGNVGGGPGNLDAHIEEARIYDGVLTQAEIKALTIGGEAVEARHKLATIWARMKAK
jgi:hypothetical protein